MLDLEVRWAGEPDVVMQLSGIPGAAVAVRTCQVRGRRCGLLRQRSVEAAPALQCSPVRGPACFPASHLQVSLPVLPACPAVLRQVAGMLRVVLSPIEAELPFLTGITLSLIERPYLDFDVR